MDGANRSEKRKQLAEHYAGMTDEELEELAREGGKLTDLAREVLRAEIARRGLTAEVEQNEAAVPEPSRRKPVTLRTLRDVPQAQLAKSILESAGIQCFLADENLVQMDWFYSNVIGGIKLWVDEGDAEAAAKLLDAGIPANFEVEGVGEFEQPGCPHCQSLDVAFAPTNWPLTKGAAGVRRPATAGSDRWKCNSCGYEWEESSPIEPSFE